MTETGNVAADYLKLKGVKWYFIIQKLWYELLLIISIFICFSYFLYIIMFNYNVIFLILLHLYY